MTQAETNQGATPSLSVVLPVYNGAAFIEETLSSILDQTFTDYELICIDDGSTDNSIEMLAEYAGNDSRMRVISQTNEGPGAARNRGLDAASGEFVIILDADDIYDSLMFEAMIAKAKDSDADVVICRSTLFDDASGEELDSSWVIKNDQLPKSSTFSPENIKDFIFTAFMGWPWDKLYRRSYIEREKLRFPKLSNSEDLFFVFLSLAKASRISVIDSSLIRHRMNRAGSVSGSRKSAPLDFYKSICEFKAALKMNADDWANYSWSFFNWALEYLVWNISTMDDPEGRRTQLDALINGDFAEIELEEHAESYFSLFPANYNQYLALLREAYGVKQEEPPAKRSISNHIASFFSRVDQDGLKTALSAFISYRLGKGSEADDPVPVIPMRASSYAITEMSRLLPQDELNGATK